MERSGIHELTAAYALDALDERDEREYEEHLGRCATCRDDLAALQEASAALAFGVDERPPPPALRERILARARAEPSNVIPLRRWRAVTYASSALAAAAALAAVGFAVWATSLRGELRDERAAVAILSDPDARTIALAGAAGELVVTGDGRAALVTELAPAPSVKAYVVWVIRGDVPAPAGSFDGRERRDLVPLDERVSDDAVVAVTLEDDRDAEVPSSDPLFTAEV